MSEVVHFNGRNQTIIKPLPYYPKVPPRRREEHKYFYFIKRETGLLAHQMRI